MISIDLAAAPGKSNRIETEPMSKLLVEDRIRSALAIVLLLAMQPLAAHDFWIEPSKFQLAPNAPVLLELRVGDHFRGEIFPRHSAHIESFQVVTPSDERRPIPGLEGRNPAGVFRFDAPGIFVVSYRSRHSFLSMEPAKFRSYLAEEGLDQVSSQLAESDQPAVRVREAFSRCAKALILVGESAGGTESTPADRRIGLPLELVAETNPFRLAGGGELRLRVYFGDAPIRGVLVAALARSPEQRIAARSDAEGLFTLRLTPGVWLVKTVHMVPAEAGLDADWKSLWASLTLEIPAQR